MNNYCTGQWNAKDANTNDLASEWPINCCQSEGSGIFSHVKSHIVLPHFFCLVPHTSEQQQTSLRNSNPIACMDLEADKPLRKVRRWSCHIFRGIRCQNDGPREHLKLSSADSLFQPVSFLGHYFSQRLHGDLGTLVEC